MLKLISFLSLFCSLITLALQNKNQDQPYTSYFTGNETDKEVQPNYGITMMGGRSEHDEAMKWFLEKANGGDILVLRASGSYGYNDYLYSTLGVEVNPVESLVIKTDEAANHPYVINKIKKAEAIWMAGGDQYNYINIWGNSEMKDALNDHITIKKGAIGGTSAGMAVLGEWFFSAKNGTITSEEALGNPYHEKVSLGNNFLNIEILEHTITDTHYADRNRQGRHIAFMSQIVKETNAKTFGIACDEYTAVCIGSDGIARTYGLSPERQNAVYFIQTNCSNQILPEQSMGNKPLNWNLNEEALSVYKIIADESGKATFDLKKWRSGTGGQWFYWYIENGKWFEKPGTSPNCN